MNENKGNRLSRLFEKTKYNKKSHSFSSSSLSLQKPYSLSSSQHNLLDNDAVCNLIQQQRKRLAQLDLEKTQYISDISHLQDQLCKTHIKFEQRTKDLKQLKSNYYQKHVLLRTTTTTTADITHKLHTLLHKIHTLAKDLLVHAEQPPNKLNSLWLNLGPSIHRLGTPLPPHRILMLTEKFIMDVLVQNLNIYNNLPPEFLELQQWFEKNGVTNIRQQELAFSLMTTVNTERHLKHLYKGLRKVYPTLLTKHETTYKAKLKESVEYAVALGCAMKGHVTAVDVREGVQKLDTKLMRDEDGQQAGVVAFCVVPPFVIKVGNKYYELLVKGRVLCFPK